MTDLIRSSALMLVLLNPFLLIIYLTDVVQKRPCRQFANVLARAGLIAAAVFCFFAVVGDAVFFDVIQAEFASFQIFGGVIFFIIGLQFVFRGPTAKRCCVERRSIWPALLQCQSFQLYRQEFSMRMR